MTEGQSANDAASRFRRVRESFLPTTRRGRSFKAEVSNHCQARLGPCTGSARNLSRHVTSLAEHFGSVAEIITALATAGLVIVAFFQFRRFNKQVRADFTYKVYR